ncbi:hypothetical protein KCP78_17340 [Salmonella enterica subsp. enterica]|nr:hypothetical protein KCP78_17340 [Salmonella enterica subsp. enterica]
MVEQYPNDTSLLDARRLLMSRTVAGHGWPGWRWWSAIKSTAFLNLFQPDGGAVAFAILRRLFRPIFVTSLTALRRRRWLALGKPAASGRRMRILVSPAPI